MLFVGWSNGDKHTMRVVEAFPPAVREADVSVSWLISNDYEPLRDARRREVQRPASS
jgi:hypothetical protein